MKREQALSRIRAAALSESQNRMQLSCNVIHEIYNDFESKTCSNCEYYHSDYPCLEIEESKLQLDSIFKCSSYKQKNKTCSNCHHKDDIQCEMCKAAWNFFRVKEDKFSCNQWKSKE